MEALRFQILGPVRGQCGGRELGLGSPQQQAMLAALLLGPGRTAGAEELVEALWGERPPTRGRAVLRTYAWRLRQALAAAGVSGDEVLVSVAGGYRLALAEGAVDADAADAFARAAERAQAADQGEEARDLLRQALDLWHGEPLAAVPGPFAERHRQRFAELRLSLLERRIGLDVHLGRPDRCIPELRTLTAEHPLRESLYGLLMRAFAGAGRRGDALDVYRTARRRLVDELGVEPGAELAAVHAAVLAGGSTPPPGRTSSAGRDTHQGRSPRGVNGHGAAREAGAEHDRGVGRPSGVGAEAGRWAAEGPEAAAAPGHPGRTFDDDASRRAAGGAEGAGAGRWAAEGPEAGAAPGHPGRTFDDDASRGAAGGAEGAGAGRWAAEGPEAAAAPGHPGRTFDDDASRGAAAGAEGAGAGRWAGGGSEAGADSGRAVGRAAEGAGVGRWAGGASEVGVESGRVGGRGVGGAFGADVGAGAGRRAGEGPETGAEHGRPGGSFGHDVAGRSAGGPDGPEPGTGRARDGSARASRPDARAADARPVYAPAQLPPREPDFVGREELVARLRGALARPPQAAPAVLALAGMGGVGKTALALHVAHRARPAFPGGQLYVDLRGDTATPGEPEGVLGEFLAALGVPPDRLPEGTAARSALFRSVADGRRLLIVLDNAADADQVRPLLPGTDSCATLVTSRKRLVGLPATLQLDLAVFAPQEARELLALVVGAERVAAEADAAEELLRATGWLPLAVRIVAARLAARPGWTLRAMGDRLTDERRRIDELRIGELAVAAAFELGYRQLGGDQAEVFRLLGAVDATELGLRSAAALLGRDEPEAERLLESLVDVALLESPADGRYRHHDLLRDFARHVSARTAPGEEAAARARLLDFLLAAACGAFEQAVPGDPIRGVLAPDPQPSQQPSSPHVRIAFADRDEAQEWAVAEAPGAVELAARIAQEALGEGVSAQVHRAMLPKAVNLLVALSPFGQGASRARLARTLEATARAGAAQQDPRSEGRSCFLAGNIALGAGRYELAEQRTLRAVELCRAADDPAILRQALNDLGVVAHATGRYAEAVERFTEAVALARILGHRSGETASALNAAAAQIRIGQSAAVMTRCQDLLGRLQQEGDRSGAAHTQFVLGLALQADGRALDAAERFEAAATEWTALGAAGRAAHARLQLARTLLEAGAVDRAADQAQAALAEFDRLGSTVEQARARSLLEHARAVSVDAVSAESGPTACQKS
ncbi:AfsR/SARP family transcriptional regulator [Streptacidiphilus melanogenes]|uniref:AfsR/SARP family transcriptional regulator n=1 Tax=Streptacidiphilus melanogenes TaxID=411235 RepID=UPI000693AABB|nr:BTAD domain-containing putative transcriptional regulator [Streptacidiphilus melanogenes]